MNGAPETVTTDSALSVPEIAAAQSRIQQILSDRNFLAGRHKDQAALTTEYTDLNRSLHPPEPTPESKPPPAGGIVVPPEAQAARQQIRAVLADKAHPYWKGDRQAVDHMTELYKKAEYGEGEASPEAGPRKEPSKLDPDTGQPIPPAPDSRLASIWNQSEVRAFVGEIDRIGMKAGELMDWLRYEQDPKRPDYNGAETANLLQKEWGKDFEKNLSAARSMMFVLGGGKPEVAEKWFADTGLGDDPAVVRRLAVLGQRFAPLIEKVRRNLTDPKSPFQDQRHPGHAEAVKEHAQLYRKLLGAR